MSPIWNYKKWWEGKRCRMAGHNTPFRTVVKVEFVGPPSGVYGAGGLVFAGDTQVTWIPHGKSFRPGRKHVEVEPTPHACKGAGCLVKVSDEQLTEWDGFCDSCLELGKNFDAALEAKP